VHDPLKSRLRLARGEGGRAPPVAAHDGAWRSYLPATDTNLAGGLGTLLVWARRLDGADPDKRR
jgi:hypothetical protein